jgi:hypothetical protein
LSAGSGETTGIYDLKQGYQQQQKQRGHTNYSRETSKSRNNGDIRNTEGIPVTAETTVIYDLKQGYQQQLKQWGSYTTYRRDISNSRNNGDIRTRAGIPRTRK